MSNPQQLDLLFQAQAASAASVRRIWSVKDLLSAVRTAVEREYTDVYVEGEISNYRPAESGHLYFTLKDGDAQIPIVMFRSQARLLRFKPANGMQVVARGRVTVYEPRGQLQVSAEYLEPKGAGALQVAFEQLKAKLAAEGLFDQARKRPIPAMPKRIGIVTSPRGAAIQDMLNILRRRHASVHVLIFPAQVQGEYAPVEVAAGVRALNAWKKYPVDVIVVARGGGSAEDLAAFNDEDLARTIVASEIPTISAVGHETDFTIADFVADLRAPTPSAAAELVIESKAQIEDKVISLDRRLKRALEYRLMQARRHYVELAQNRVFARFSELLGRRQQRVDELTHRMRHGIGAELRGYRSRVDVATTRVRAHDLRFVLLGMRKQVQSASGRLALVAQQRLQGAKSHLNQYEARLQALSPLNILERGYAIVFDAKGALVKDPAAVKSGERITARVARGEIRAIVDSE
jgi:exodeoxyribonuclease VII large subunit